MKVINIVRVNIPGMFRIEGRERKEVGNVRIITPFHFTTIGEENYVLELN